MNERINEIEKLFNDYKIKTDLKITELQSHIKKQSYNSNSKEYLIKEDLDITIVKYKKSILVKSTGSTNTTQPYKELFKELEGKWMKMNDICGWIYLGKCQDSNIEKNSKFIIDKIKEKGIQFNVIYES